MVDGAHSPPALSPFIAHSVLPTVGEEGTLDATDDIKEIAPSVPSRINEAEDEHRSETGGNQDENGDEVICSEPVFLAYLSSFLCAGCALGPTVRRRR